MNLKAPFQRLGKALTATPQALDLVRGMGGGFFMYPRSAYVDGAYIEATSATYGHMYATQENVRTVVDYIARVAADRSLKFIRYVDGEKEEDPLHPAAATMRWPNDWQGQREIMSSFVRDWLVYDDAYLWDLGPYLQGRRFLVRIPPYAVGDKSGNTMQPTGYRISFKDGTWLDLPTEQVIHLRGYSARGNKGVSPMETLRVMLAESAARKAQSIDQIRGGMVKGGIIERPIEATSWSQQAMERFSETFSNQLRGVARGSTPILEEGMHFVEAGITPREAEMLANRKFALETVCNVYGLNPAIFETSGNTAEARRAAEEDVVTPLHGRVAEALTRQLVNVIYGDEDCAFKFRAKSESDIGKLFTAGSQATGGSTVTANEFRDQFLNLPPVDGGDELVKHPGSQSGSIPPGPGENPRGRPAKDPADLAEAEKALREQIDRLGTKKQRAEDHTKALTRRMELKSRRDRKAGDFAELFRNHFRRQQRSKASLEDPRWDRELAADLLEMGNAYLQEEGTRTAERLMGKFDMALTVNYMRAGAKAVAEAVNAQTAQDYRDARAALQKADGPETEGETRDRVLTGAIGGRSDQLGMTRATALSGFAVYEAASQNPTSSGGPRIKEWVWSGAANSRHGGVAGETVELFHEFSNGMQYPGDHAGGVEQCARCECALDVY